MHNQTDGKQERDFMDQRKDETFGEINNDLDTELDSLQSDDDDNSLSEEMREVIEALNK